MDFMQYFDFDRSIRDYEFTYKSVQNIKRLIHTKKFKHSSGKAIFDYLSNEVEFVFFHDYLKRYLYEKAVLVSGSTV